MSKETLLPYQRHIPMLLDIEVRPINLRAEYLGMDSECALFTKLDTPMRSNQKNYRKQSCFYRKSRKRIVTLFLQLCD